MSTRLGQLLSKFEGNEKNSHYKDPIFVALKGMGSDSSSDDSRKAILDEIKSKSKGGIPSDVYDVIKSSKVGISDYSVVIRAGNLQKESEVVAIEEKLEKTLNSELGIKLTELVRSDDKVPCIVSFGKNDEFKIVKIEFQNQTANVGNSKRRLMYIKSSV